MTTSNILVIEDDPLVARTIERCLRGDDRSLCCDVISPSDAVPAEANETSGEEG